ncbi:MAG: 3-hydroxyacyl-CoA dehydrogenase family protein [Salinivirgaceae bacterium]|nr:3-hydroxyacyl-CoA dehydrogenase family protein [Salinivirgaceae bacterium]
MTFNQRFKNVSVLGAAGKMGSGILYLNTIYLSQLKLAPENKNETFVINAIDQSQERLNGLLNYTKSLLLKWAEKNIVWLRKAYDDRDDLIENGEIIDAYVYEAMTLIRPSTIVDAAYESSLIFEAVLENIELKTELFTKITANNKNNPWFLTNTSSIPIKELDTKANLNGNIIGCHFYNPPAIQKLIELIEIDNGNKELSKLVYDFGKELGKVMVPSNDIAGFIGNGFFMRDLLFALQKVKDLKPEFTFAESVVIVDTITRDFMLRPMGIFQLIDYVGVEVCSFILNVMNGYLPEELHSKLLNKMVDKAIMGGQNSDGSQKAGFFTYKRSKIESVYDHDKGAYVTIDEVLPKVNAYLGDLPENQSWKALSRNKKKESILEGYFKKLNSSKSAGCQLASEYMQKMNEIGTELVNTKVTDSAENVNTVMITGFHHLYGPINNYS